MMKEEIIKDLKATIKKGGNPKMIESLKKKLIDLKKDQVNK